MVSKLLVVVVVLLSVIVALSLVIALRKTSSLDVERWHRTLRVLREAADPNAHQPSDEQVVVDTSDRNVRVLPASEERGEGEQQHGQEQPVDDGWQPDEPRQDEAP